MFLAGDGFAIALEVQCELAALSGGLDFELGFGGVFGGQDIEPTGKCEHPLKFLAGFIGAVKRLNGDTWIVRSRFDDSRMGGLLGVEKAEEEGEEQDGGDFSHVWTCLVVDDI